ncbi:MAG: flagellar hook-length control protein FliK [Myxococcota bacterium]
MAMGAASPQLDGPRGMAPPAASSPASSPPPAVGPRHGRAPLLRPDAKAPTAPGKDTPRGAGFEAAAHVSERPGVGSSAPPSVAFSAVPSPGPAAPAAAPATPTSGAPPVVEPSQTLLQLALADASLSIDAHRQVVNVALDTEATGALELELRLHEGRAHVLVSGPSAPLVAQHAPALREVLSQQGLALGDFSTSQQQRREHPPEAAERDTVDEPGAHRPLSVSGTSRPRRHEGRIDVEA